MRAEYEIKTTSKPNWAAYKIFNSQSDADTYVSSLGSDYTATYYADYVEPSDSVKLAQDQDFLNSFLQTIKLDVRKINNKATRLNVINKLKSAKETMDFGDVENVRDFIDSVSVGPIFSQGVKDKYLGLIDNYLNSV